MLRTGWIIMLLFVSNCTGKEPEGLVASQLMPFGITYSEFDVEQASGYKLLVTEPYLTDRTQILQLKQKGAKTLAYLSLGEVHPSRTYFKIFEKSGLRGRNLNQESFYIDLSKDTVRQVFLKQVIPNYIAQGFDGLFLDTIDAVAPYSERKDQQQQMADLINDIRTKFPDLILIQNAGFFLLNETAAAIDAVAIESVATSYDFSTASYSMVSDEEFLDRMALVDSLHKTYLKPFLIIDFSKELENESQIRTRLDSTGHPYMISNIGFRGLPVLYQKREAN